VTRNLRDIARDLTQLVQGQSQGERALLDLARQLERPNYSNLAGVDLTRRYPPVVMLPDDTPLSRRLANGLELARDVLIFVPVVYTWWKISEALVAYDQYTGSEPFLLAWQQGFDHHMDSLSASARVVAGVVLVVILLTGIAHLVRSWYDQRVQQRQQRLTVLLGEASLQLTQPLVAGTSDVSWVDLTKIGATIATSAQSLEAVLRKSSTDIASAVNANPGSRLHEMFEKWTAAASELSALGTRLRSTQETVEHLRDIQIALSGMAAQIGEETRRLLAALETERSLSRQEAHAHHELAAEVGESTRLLGESLKGLNERTEQFNELILRLAFVVGRLDSYDTQSSSFGGGYQ
jgi:hypothetical protein